MGITLEAYRLDACCLCGSAKELTGEHKIKASVLRKEFGTGNLVIGRFNEPDRSIKSAQSVKSKAFHFSAKICHPCNSDRTQPADREFDKFHQIVHDLMANRDDPKLAFDHERYEIGSEAYLNVFRYFAKLLCCHMAESSAPRLRHMSHFALGRARTNCIWLNIGHDWAYKQTSNAIGPHQYAAHGGLVVYGSGTTAGPTGFHSTLTVGAIRYTFFSRLNMFEQLELKLGHRQFYEWCQMRVREAMDQPLSEADCLKLGLAVGEPLDEQEATKRPVE